MTTEMKDTPVMLSTRNLSKIYRTRSGTIEALRDVSIDVPKGSFVSIVGASGCGKSTLLNVLAALESASDGHAFRNGKPLVAPSREVGIVFQEHVLLPWLTVLENVLLPAELYGLAKEDSEPRARALLKLSGLEGFEQRKPSDLSGGMKQRTAICRALLTDPQVLLMDEPFGALDALTREELSLELLTVWERDRKTALLITHDINEAVLLSDTVIVMSPRPGRVIETIDINLPRPRGPKTELEPEFRQLTHHIKSLIFSQRH